MDKHTTDFKRSLLMHICGKINKMDKRSITIMKKTPLVQLRSIGRNAKSLKDPDPLISMMANISMKYPITVDNEKLSKFSLPKEFLMPSSDSRRYNRTPCKLSTVDYYIEKSEKPNNDVVKNVDTLMKFGNEKFNYVKNINWDSIKFIIKNISYDRMLVPTNPQDFVIPKDFVDEAICQAIGKDIFNSFRVIPQSYISYVQKILEERVPDHMTIENIIRYIRNVITPRYRFIPIIKGVDEKFIWVKHVLVQNRYKILNFEPFKPKSKEDLFQIISVCKNIIHFFLRSPNRIREVIYSVLLYNSNLYEILSSEEREEGYIQGVKALMEIEAHAMYEYRGFKSYVNKSSGISQKLKNLSGLEFTSFLGKESIVIYKDNIKATLEKDGSLIESISVNFITIDELRELIAFCAVVCKNNFTEMYGRSNAELKKNAYNFHFKNPWYSTFFDNKEVYLKFVRDYERKWKKDDKNKLMAGKIVFINNYTPKLPQKKKLYIDRDLSLYYYENNERVYFRTIEKPKRVIVKEMDTTSNLLLEYLEPQKMLRRAFKLMLAEAKEIRRNIMKKIWLSYCPSISFYLDPSKIQLISAYCKNLSFASVMTDRNSTVAIFYYMFAGLSPNTEGCIGEFFYDREHLIDLSLTSGIAVLDINTHSFSLWGESLSVQSTDTVVSKNFAAPIEGYKIKAIATSKAYPATIKELIDRKNNYADGTLFQTYCWGKTIYLERDRMYTVEILNTLFRHIPESANELVGIKQLFESNELKRKRVSNDDEYMVKKSKKEEDYIIASSSSS